MPRPPRIDFPGARHHVMNRGARRAPVLGDDAARQDFLAVLAELPARFSVEVHAYALMSNHYHLLLRAPEGNVSRAMRHLGAEFTQRVNRRNEWDGPVFRGRFRNRLVGDDAYWRHLLSYLHLNPVEAGLVELPEHSPWTSHRAYLGLDAPPPWLTTAELLRRFGSVAELVAYVEEHRTGRRSGPEGWDPKRLWAPDITSVARPGPPEVSLPTPTTKRALEQVARVTGAPIDALREARLGRHDNRARWMAAWWLQRSVGLTHREIAHVLDCHRRQVSHLLGRARAKADDPVLAAWRSALEASRRER